MLSPSDFKKRLKRAISHLEKSEKLLVGLSDAIVLDNRGRKSKTETEKKEKE